MALNINDSSVVTDQLTIRLNTNIVVSDSSTVIDGFDYALSFDGSQNYVLLSTPVNIPSRNSPQTLFAIINMPNANGNQDILTIQNSIQLRTNSGQLEVAIWGGGTYITGGSLSSNSTLRVAYTWDGTTNVLFINGIQVVSNTNTHFDSSPTGVVLASYGSGEWLNGIIARPKIWNRSLSSTEIANLQNNIVPASGLVLDWQMNEGSGTTIADASGNGNTGTLIGNPLPTWVAGLSTPKVQILETGFINVSDSSTVTDYGPFYYDDSVIVTDTNTTRSNEQPTTFESSSATDIVSMRMNAGPVSLFDASTVTENITVRLSITLSVADTTTVTDAPTVVASATPQGLFDVTTVTDSVTMLIPLPVSVSDSSTVADTAVAYLYYSITVNDASVATDAVTQILETTNLFFAEDVHPIDNVMMNEPEGPIVVADGTIVTDAVANITLTWNIPVSDSSIATDVPTVHSDENPVVVDQSTVTDAPTVTTTDNYLLIDSSTVTDQPVMMVDENPVVFDATTATDVPSVVVTYAINVYEQSTVTEFNYEYITILYLSVLDQSTVTENIVFEPGYSKNAPLYYDIGDGLSMMLGPQKAAYWGNFGRPTSPVIGQWGINTDAGVVEVFQGDYWFTIGAEAPLTMPVLLESGSYTMAYTDGVILANAASGNIIITLPHAHGGIGREYTIKKTDGTSNTVTLLPINAETIDSATNQIITTAYTSLTIVSDGSSWFLV